MDVFAEYLAAIEPPEHRARMAELLGFVHEHYPELEMRIAWNQPMFVAHGTFIVGFSISKQHIALAPEGIALEHFATDVKAAGYKQTKMLIQIPWSSEINYKLISRIIDFNIEDKKDVPTFWRK